jgi:Tol biopolymer transport system component
VTGASSQAPVWTADGSRVIYRGTRAGTRNLYWKSADGTGAEERLTTKENVTQTPDSVSPDGAWALFYDTDGIWGLPLTGDRTPKNLFRSGGRDVAGRVAPNGKWMAYQSTVSGRSEIYVQPFPDAGASQLVSTNGGVEPLWSHDGRELFYVNGDTQMAVPVTFTPAFAAGQPRVLHQGRFRASVNGNTPYAMASDGRFLRVQQVQPDRAVTQLQVVLNWRPGTR